MKLEQPTMKVTWSRKFAQKCIDFTAYLQISLKFTDFLKISADIGNFCILPQHQHRKLWNISSIPKYQQTYESCPLHFCSAQSRNVNVSQEWAAVWLNYIEKYAFLIISFLWISLYCPEKRMRDFLPSQTTRETKCF